MRRAKYLTLLALLPILIALWGCPASNSVEFAAVLPLTGSASVYGQAIQRGIELGMEQLAENNTTGYTVTMRVEDTGSDPAQAAQLLRSAFSTSTAAIGGVTSDEALAMVEVINDVERVLLSPTASSPALSGSSRYFFRIFPASTAEAPPLASFVVERLQAKELVIAAQDSAFGEGSAGSFTDSYSGVVLGRVDFETDGDYQTMVSQVMDLLPAMDNEEEVRAVYVAASADSLVNALKALRGGGFDRGRDYLVTSSALASPEVLAAAGDAAERIYFAQTVFNAEDESEPVKSFVANYETKYGSKPDVYAAHGYDAVAVFMEALSKVQLSVPSDFLKGMRAVQGFPGVTGNLQFRETGDAQKFMRVYFVSEGQPQDFDEWLEGRQKAIEEERNRIRREMERLRRSNN